MLTPLRVLIVEDNEDDALLIVLGLKKGGYNPEYLRVETAPAMQSALCSQQWDIILCDYHLPGFNVQQALALLKATDIDIPMIIVTGTIGEEAAVECMRLGARDYIRKENLSRLIPAIERELAEVKVRAALRQIEREWQKSWENYRLISETIHDLIITSDFNWKITYANKTVRDLFGGIDPVGMNITDYTPPELLEKQRLMMKRRLEGFAGVTSYEWKIADALGQNVFLDVKSQLFFENGKAAGILFIARNITERKKTEEELKQAQEATINLVERLDLALHAANLGVWDWDIQTNQVVLDKRMHELYGTNKEDSIITTDAWISNLHPDDVAFSKEEFRKALNNEKPYNTEFRYILPNGAIRHIRSYASITRNSQGKPLRMTGINYDITERKKMEARLMQAQKMEAIGTLAGGIAHDFNNILGAIIGYAGMAQEELPPESPTGDCIEEILRASDRAKNLVAQILAFSRRDETARKPLMIIPIVKEIVKLLRAMLPSTIFIRQNIQLKDAVILADATQMHQVLLNLCTNAAHAMQEKGGTLTIGLKTITVAENHPLAEHLEAGPYLELQVTDDGHGISEKIQGQIFDPFFTTKKTGEGTGMGLSVVHGIVKSYGGHIRLESKVGEGTTFFIYLPLLSGQDAQADSARKIVVSAVGGTERILIVDDQDFMVDMMSKSLLRLGYQVTAQNSSRDALSLFQANPSAFDLVITDQTMPYLTGADMARDMLGIRPDIPIILCTGFSAAISEEQARLIGIREYVMKPVIMSEFTRLIRNVLEENGQKLQSSPPSITSQEVYP